MNRLRNHPFPVVARFERVVAVSFAFPEAVLRGLVPPALEIDAFAGFGFVTVAMVWTKEMRPAGFPAFLGQDFFLAGYRIFTRLRDESGRRLRGLHILRSETDRRRMVWLGNFMTSYRYRHVQLKMKTDGSETNVKTFRADGSETLDLTYDLANGEPNLPAGSPFKSWHEARHFAGPMPFTFSALADGSFLVIEGKRQNWVPKLIQVRRWEVELFAEEPFRGIQPILANAFMVEDVSYRWEKGRIVHPGGVA